MKENTAVTVTADDLEHATQRMISELVDNKLFENIDRKDLLAALAKAEKDALDHTATRISGCPQWDEFLQKENERLVPHQNRMMWIGEIGYVICHGNIDGKDYEWEIPFAELRDLVGTEFMDETIDQIAATLTGPDAFILLNAIRAPKVTAYALDDEVWIGLVMRSDFVDDDDLEQFRGDRQRLYDMANEWFNVLAEETDSLDILIKSHDMPMQNYAKAVDQATAKWMKENEKKYCYTICDEGSRAVFENIDIVGPDLLKEAIVNMALK